MTKKSDSTSSFYFSLILEKLKDLQSYKIGISNKDFEILCRENEVFKKNLLLEFKDIKIIIDKFIQRLI